MDCGTHTTKQWFDCKDESGNKLCRSCYARNRLDVATATGTTCVECGTDTTSQWHKSKDTPGTKICKNCYNKNYYKKKKAASANEK